MEPEQPPKKKFKFDPPTFKFGDEEEEVDASKLEEEEAAKKKKKEEEEDDYDAYVIPSHVPGVKWSRREIDLLVESSRRWMRDQKEEFKREQQQEEKKDKVENSSDSKTSIPLTEDLVSSSDMDHLAQPYQLLASSKDLLLPVSSSVKSSSSSSQDLPPLSSTSSSLMDVKPGFMKATSRVSENGSPVPDES